MSENCPEKHPDGFVSIRVVPREIGKILYADRWQDIARSLRKRDDLNREYRAALKDGTDAANVASISSRLSAAKAAVRPEWGRLLIEADRLMTSDALPLYHYRRGGLPYPISKDCFAKNTDQHAHARRLMLLTGKLQGGADREQLYQVKRGRQVDLRSLSRNSAGIVTLVSHKDDVTPLNTREVPDLVVVLERDLRKALRRLQEELGEAQPAAEAESENEPQPAPEGGEPRPPGKPSLEAEIKDAYWALEKGKEVDFDAFKTALYKPIREKVRKVLGKPNLLQGLSDETIRTFIAPLFKAGKAKQQSSST